MTFRVHTKRLLLSGTIVAAIAVAAGCSSLGYYAQSIDGHFAMLRAARPIPELVADPGTAEALKQRLKRVQEIRAFAILASSRCPTTGATTRYSDLVDGRSVVWNVFAAPDSLAQGLSSGAFRWPVA